MPYGHNMDRPLGTQSTGAGGTRDAGAGETRDAGAGETRDAGAGETPAYPGGVPRGVRVTLQILLYSAITAIIIRMIR
ncbi:MAG: hypothetical protein FWH01_16080 [Oscillospiraceae bacterium]|nr:hypothetical protein [Oscillospiraceae bacterium]